MICCIKATVLASLHCLHPNGFYFAGYSLKACINQFESESIFHEYKAILKAQLKPPGINLRLRKCTSIFTPLMCDGTDGTVRLAYGSDCGINNV